MPSETVAPLRSGRLAWLRSQGLGLACGQLTVLLLGIGSVVIAATRDGASRELQVDELEPFFREPSWTHLWLYVLTGVLLLYALNTALCTWDAVVSKVQRRTTELHAWGPPLMHVAFLGLLVAHAVGGFGNREGPQVVVSSAWTDVGAGRQLRLLSVDREALPNGKPKRVDATVELRAADGTVRETHLGYNQPIVAGLVSSLLVLAQAGDLPSGAVLAIDGVQCSLRIDGGCEAGGVVVRLVGVEEEASPRVGLAQVAVSVAGGRLQALMLREGLPRPLGGHEVALVSLTSEPALLLRSRATPGHPIALVSCVLMTLGMAFLGRRWG